MLWGRAVEDWTAYMRAAANSPHTIEARAYQVARMGRDLGKTPATVTASEVVGWFGAQDWKPNTKRTYRGALRAFYSWAVAAGVVEVSPVAVLPPVKVPRALPHPTPEEDYRWALRIAEPRVRLAILLAGAYGLRRDEVARSRREWVARDVTGAWSLMVIGKGGHERAVPLLDETARLILAMPDGWLFPSPRRAGAHLTKAHLAKLVSAELPAGYTMHSLRHRCGTVALELTNDLRAVQELLGHAKPETTAIYTLVSSSRVRAAVEAAA